MFLSKNASLSQGFGLPKMSEEDKVSIVKGLSTPFISRFSRWIKHPQAMTHIGQLKQFTHQSGQFSAVIAFTLYRGRGSGAKEKAPYHAFLCAHSFAATRSTYVFPSIGLFLMIYTFLIASKRLSVRNLSRVRKVSVVASSESGARSQLAGLPLIFISRVITKGDRA